MDALAHRYLDTLRRTQWLDPGDLLNYQARLLTDIARHSFEAAPFYRDRLKPLFSSGAIDLRRWREVPLMTRADVRANADAMRALSVPRQVARETAGRTSGTTGHALHFHQSELAAIVSLCQYERMLEAHGVDTTAHLARIRREDAGVADYPEGSEDTGWNLTSPASRRSYLNIQTSIAEQADWLCRRGPAYLTTYQSTAGALARHMLEAGRRLPLRGVLTLGETVDPANREDVRRAFDCETIDAYGATEIGYAALQCPTGRGYHVCAESVLVELIDANGDDVAPGERGQVVLTSLYNFAMPFIRYAIGDFAIAADGICPCGRSLPLLTAVLGRQRNIFTFPDGSQHSPWQWRSHFLRHLKAKQFQIVQVARDRIELRYVPQDASESPDEALLEKIGREIVHPLVRVHPVAVPAIERHPSGKIEDCISLVSTRTIGSA